MEIIFLAGQNMFLNLRCCVDSNGNIYVLQISSKTIKVFDSSGAYVKVIGTGWLLLILPV